MADGKLEYEISADASKFAATVDRSIAMVGKLGVGIVAAGTAIAAGGLARGFNFARQVNDAQVAMGNMIERFQGLSKEASKNEAAKAMAEIARLEPQASATMEQMVQGFLASAAAAQSVGVSVKQNVDLVARFSNALANSFIPAEQLAQEMRSILTGNIGQDSQLARTLGITNESVNRARQQGKLYEYLVETLGSLGEAGDTAGVAFSTLQSAVDKALGELGKPLLKVAIKEAKELAAAIESPAFKRGLAQMGKDLQYLAEQAAGLSRHVARAGAGLVEFSKASVVFGRAVKGVVWDGKSFEKAYKDAKNLHKGLLDLQDVLAKIKEESGSAIAFDPNLTNKSLEQFFRPIAARAVEIEKLKDALGELNDAAKLMRLDEQISAYRGSLGNLNPQDIARSRNMTAGHAYSPEQIKLATELVKLEMQRARLAKEMAERERDVTNARIDARDAARRQVADNQVMRGNALADLALLEAKANGQDSVAQQLEREIRQQELIAMYKRQLNATDEEALRLAERRMKAEEKLEQSGRRRIQGYSQEQASFAKAQDTFRGLDAFSQKQRRSVFDGMRTPGLDAWQRLQDRSKPAFPSPGTRNRGADAFGQQQQGEKNAREAAQRQQQQQAAIAKATTDQKLAMVVTELQTLNRKMAQLEAA